MNVILSSKLQLSSFILSASSQYVSFWRHKGRSWFLWWKIWIFGVESSCATCLLSKTVLHLSVACSSAELQSVTDHASNQATKHPTNATPGKDRATQALLSWKLSLTLWFCPSVCVYVTYFSCFVTSTLTLISQSWQKKLTQSFFQWHIWLLTPHPTTWGFWSQS